MISSGVFRHWCTIFFWHAFVHLLLHLALGLLGLHGAPALLVSVLVADVLHRLYRQVARRRSPPEANPRP